VRTTINNNAVATPAAAAAATIDITITTDNQSHLNLPYLRRTNYLFSKSYYDTYCVLTFTSLRAVFCASHYPAVD